MSLEKEYDQYYWQEADSTFKAKVFISEHDEEVIVRVIWFDGRIKRSSIISVHPLPTCKRMAQVAIDIVKSQINCPRHTAT